MQVIATAGHVDHGKSSLVRALTGMEPDRWEEEHRRGLTIGLGFVWTELAGQDVAFVDVPGHGRFVPTMLAGVGPVPAVLFVVAADEGWMPQSEEHLAALDALDVQHGVLAVTRSDLADPEPARQQALAHIADSSLGIVPSVAVNSRTADGVDGLRHRLAELTSGLDVPDRERDVRLWVDRSFAVVGAGTVATGTLPAGTVRVGDELALHSAGKRLRVRGLHALNRPRDEVTGVARVAVNLRGIHPDQVAHGDALLTPSAWVSSGEVDVAQRCGADLPARLTVHIGSAAVSAQVRPLGARAARLHLDSALPLRIGDRLLLRNPGQHRVVDTGTVLDVRPLPLRRRGAARTWGAELGDLAERRLEDVAAVHLHRRGPLRAAEMRTMGLPVCGVLLGSDWRVDPDQVQHLVRRLADEVDTWHRENPLSAGVPTEALRQKLGLPDRELVPPLARRAELTCGDGMVLRSGVESRLPAAVQNAVDAVRAQLCTTPFAAPEAGRLRELGLGPREIAAAVRAGLLFEPANGVVLLPDAPARAHQTLAELPQPFTLSQARKALDTTRRVAVPLLEELDRKHLTRQLADHTRHVR